MRTADDYRAARRNAMRERGEIRFWKNQPLIHKANAAAKIELRAKQVEGAVLALVDWVAKNGRAAVGPVRNAVLRTYWQTQPQTRVVSRILRELAAR